MSEAGQEREIRPGSRMPAGRGPVFASFGVASLPALFFAAVLSLLLFNGRLGPDSIQYLHWSQAVVQGDIHEIYSDVESPLALPLSQWSAGPGLVAAPLLWLFQTQPFALLSRLAEWSNHVVCAPLTGVHAMLVAAGVCALLLWLCLSRLFLVAADGNKHWMIFGLGCAFSGTHLGYYSLAYGAELVPLLPMALLMLEWFRPIRSRFGGAWLVGGCTALMIMIRPHLLLYAAPVILVTAIRNWRHADGKRLLRMVLLASLPVLAVGQIAMVNYWMTGDWRNSTYAYGDETFKSLDFAEPEIAAVLIHPLHGLLVYHPVYLIGFMAMVRLVFRASTRAERIMWGGFALTIVAHLWIQSAWYQWWLATTATFGMRGMAVAGVPCMVAIVRSLAGAHSREPARMVSLPVTALLVFASWWSWLLLMQGPSDYFTYADLLRGQGAAFLEFFVSSRALLLGFAMALVYCCLSAVLPVGGGGVKWQRLQRSGALFLIALAVSFLMRGWVDQLIFSVYYGLVICSLVLAALFYRCRNFFRCWADPLPNGVAVLSGAFVCLMLAGFGRLAIPTCQQLSAGMTPTKTYRWRATFQVNEAQSGYRDYLKIPGFDTKKRQLKQFLEPFGDLDP
jgi:hypothetical protein